MTYCFSQPKRVVFGENVFADCKDAVLGMGRKALIVTGPIVTKTGLTKRVTDCLEKWGIRYHIFSGITAEPTDEMVCNGVEVLGDRM